MAIVALLRERSIDADALMAAVGLRPRAFGHPDNVIPFARLGELARPLQTIRARGYRAAGLYANGYWKCSAPSVTWWATPKLSVGWRPCSPICTCTTGAAPSATGRRPRHSWYEVLEHDAPGGEQTFGALRHRSQSAA